MPFSEPNRARLNMEFSTSERSAAPTVTQDMLSQVLASLPSGNATNKAVPEIHAQPHHHNRDTLQESESLLAFHKPPKPAEPAPLSPLGNAEVHSSKFQSLATPQSEYHRPQYSTLEGTMPASHYSSNNTSDKTSTRQGAAAMLDSLKWVDSEGRIPDLGQPPNFTRTDPNPMAERNMQSFDMNRTGNGDVAKQQQQMAFPTEIKTESNNKPPLEPSAKRRRQKKTTKSTKTTSGGATAKKEPADANFVVGLDKPLIYALSPGGRQLNSLETQKLKDVTHHVQEMDCHVIEPLRLYQPSQLYDLMASIAEAWKNSGKAAWKKRINKIRENARVRKAPRNQLDTSELAEIADLQDKIRVREEWERQEKEKLRMENKAGKSGGQKPTARRKRKSYGSS